MTWRTIHPPSKGRTHMTTHQVKVSGLHLSVMERHPIYGLAYAFYPFITTTKAKAKDLEAAKAEAVRAAREALTEAIESLNQIDE